MRTSRAALASGLFFLVGPGTIAGLVPWLLSRWPPGQPRLVWLPLQVVGLLAMAAGLAAVADSFVRFVVEGGGTPVPVAPPERLVVGGLYRHVRNPMYVALVTTLIGEALVFGRPLLLAWAAAVALNFRMAVRRREEPFLSRRHGAAWDAYRQAVPAWIPRLSPWGPPPDSGAAG